MSYEKTIWKDGDVVTSAKLNKMEDGIAGGALIVNADIETDINDHETIILNKTWQEICDTIKSGNMAVIVAEHEEDGQMVIQEVDSIVYVWRNTSVIPNEYLIKTGSPQIYYKTNSADGYPGLSI